VTRLPAQLAQRQRGIGEADRDVAIAPRYDAERNPHAGGEFEGLDQFQHAVAGAGAKVEGDAAPLVAKELQGQHVGAGDVLHMDVVAHAGTIMGRIVVPKTWTSGSSPAATCAM
jgi:hypothetical protein